MPNKAMLPLSALLPIAVLYLFAAYRGLPDLLGGTDRKASAADHGFEINGLSALGVARVSAAFVLLSFVFLFLQSAIKFHLHTTLRAAAKKRDEKPPTFGEVKYGRAGGRDGLLADRVVGNLGEQGPLFLISLWLHAAFVSPAAAAQIGWVWLIARTIYPVVFRLGIPWLFLSTLPGYGAIAALLFPVVAAIL